MSDKLLPCPFCGGEAREYTWTSDNRPYNEWHEISCEVCSGSTCTYNTEEEAIAAWNQRWMGAGTIEVAV
jgi:Lar family restriction alleviation protein